MAMVVAVDGPAGAGKSTVARRVAQELGFTYIDTGAMYRAAAWLALQRNVAPEDESRLVELAGEMTLCLSPLAEDGSQQVCVDGVNVTTAIRTPEVSQMTSIVSVVSGLRRVIVAHQRRLAQTAEAGVVLEGRDIGTVVFPDAEVKVFLTASPEERARRRTAELQKRALPADYEQVLADQRERDARDSERADSPLKVAPDAMSLNTDGLSIDQVVTRILEYCRAAQQRHNTMPPESHV